MKYGTKLQKLEFSRRCYCTEDCKFQKAKSSLNDRICPCCEGKKCGFLPVSTKKNSFDKAAKCH
ncbi:unnamed protein product, partial [Larinioides sclopetarius]